MGKSNKSDARMPCTIGLLPERRVAFVHLIGQIDGSTLREAVEELISTPEWSPRLRILWDLRLATDLVLEPRDVASMAKIAAENIDPARTERDAIVAPAEHCLAVSRMLVLRLKKEAGMNVAAFREADEALRWMGVVPLFEATA